MMDAALRRVVPNLAYCQTRKDVGAVAIDGARQCFGSHLACAIMLDSNAEIRERVIHGLREDDFEEWARDWRPVDTVFPVAIERAMPVLMAQVHPRDQWRGLAMYQGYGRRLRIDHYLAAPVFGSRGTLAGMMTICRRPDDRPFDSQSLATATVFAGFVSATLARVTEAPFDVECDPPKGLSRRELQIAHLAASGRNNLEIALQLGIARETVKQTLRRVYSKLQVRGRAPMAAKLASFK